MWKGSGHLSVWTDERSVSNGRLKRLMQPGLELLKIDGFPSFASFHTDFEFGLDFALRIRDRAYLRQRWRSSSVPHGKPLSFFQLINQAGMCFAKKVYSIPYERSISQLGSRLRSSFNARFSTLCRPGTWTSRGDVWMGV